MKGKLEGRSLQLTAMETSLVSCDKALEDDSCTIEIHFPRSTGLQDDIETVLILHKSIWLHMKQRKGDVEKLKEKLISESVVISDGSVASDKVVLYYHGERLIYQREIKEKAKNIAELFKEAVESYSKVNVPGRHQDRDVVKMIIDDLQDALIELTEDQYRNLLVQNGWKENKTKLVTINNERVVVRPGSTAKNFLLFIRGTKANVSEFTKLMKYHPSTMNINLEQHETQINTTNPRRVIKLTDLQFRFIQKPEVISYIDEKLKYFQFEIDVDAKSLVLFTIKENLFDEGFQRFWNCLQEKKIRLSHDPVQENLSLEDLKYMLDMQDSLHHGRLLVKVDENQNCLELICTDDVLKPVIQKLQDIRKSFSDVTCFIPCHYETWISLWQLYKSELQQIAKMIGTMDFNQNDGTIEVTGRKQQADAAICELKDVLKKVSVVTFPLSSNAYDALQTEEGQIKIEDVEEDVGCLITLQKSDESVPQEMVDRKYLANLQLCLSPHTCVRLSQWTSASGSRLAVIQGRLQNLDADVLAIPVVGGTLPESVHKRLQKENGYAALQMKIKNLNCSNPKISLERPSWCKCETVEFFWMPSAMKDETNQEKNAMRSVIKDILIARVTEGVSMSCVFMLESLWQNTNNLLKARTKCIIQSSLKAFKAQKQLNLDICLLTDQNHNIAVMTILQQSCPTSEMFAVSRQDKFTSNAKGSPSHVLQPSIRVAVGELQKQKVDVLVNSSNQQLDLSLGIVSKQLNNASRGQLQRECQQKYPNGIKYGDVAVTTASGSLVSRCKMVFHGALCVYQQTGDCWAIMQSFIYRCMHEASIRLLSSIAFPILGTGTLLYPADRVTQVMFNTVEWFFTDNPSTTVNTVLFVVYDADLSKIKLFKAESMIRSYQVTSFLSKDSSPEARVDSDNDIMLQIIANDLRLCEGSSDGLLCFWNEKLLSEPSKHNLVGGHLESIEWHKYGERTPLSASFYDFLWHRSAYAYKPVSYLSSAGGRRQEAGGRRQDQVPSISPYVLPVVVFCEISQEPPHGFGSHLVTRGPDLKSLGIAKTDGGGLPANILFHVLMHKMDFLGAVHKGLKTAVENRCRTVQIALLEQDMPSDIKAFVKGLLEILKYKGIRKNDLCLVTVVVLDPAVFELAVSHLPKESKGLFGLFTNIATGIWYNAASFLRNSQDVDTSRVKDDTDELVVYARTDGDCKKANEFLQKDIEMVKSEEYCSELSLAPPQVAAQSLVPSPTPAPAPAPATASEPPQAPAVSKTVLKRKTGVTVSVGYEQFKAAEHLIGFDKVSEFCDVENDPEKPVHVKVSFKSTVDQYWEAKALQERFQSVIQDELLVPKTEWGRGTAAAAEAMQVTPDVYVVYQEDKHTMLLFAEDWDKLSKAKKRANLFFGQTKKSRSRWRYSESQSLPVERRESRDNFVTGVKTVKGRLLTVKVYQADITTLHLDIVVNAANSHLTHDIIRKGPIPVTQLAVTTGGDLPCHKVFHAVGPQWHDYGDKKKCLDYLCYTILRCLCEARNRGFTSIVFPSISASIFAVPQELCAKMYVRALKSFDQAVDGGSLREVHFVDITDEMVIIIQEEIGKTWKQPGGEEELRKDTSFINSNLGSSEAWALQRIPRKGGAFDTPRKRQQKKKTKTDCPICLSPVTDLTRLKCCDVFCKECIEEAFRVKKVCPVCFADCRSATHESTTSFDQQGFSSYGDVDYQGFASYRDVDQQSFSSYGDVDYQGFSSYGDVDYQGFASYRDVDQKGFSSNEDVDQQDLSLYGDVRHSLQNREQKTNLNPTSCSNRNFTPYFDNCNQVTKDQTEVTIESLWSKTREDNYVIGTLHGQSLTDTDFMSLKGKRCITDRVLDTLLEEMKKLHSNVYHVFTDSWNNIFDGEYRQATSGMNHTEVQFLDFKKVYGVINPSHKHWIFVGVDIENNRVIYLNSCGSTERERKNALENWRFYMMRRYEFGLEEEIVPWSCEEINQDRHKGSRNCGMISYMYAQRFLEGGVYTNLPNFKDMRMGVAMSLFYSCEKLTGRSCITCGSEEDTGLVKCKGCGRKSHRKCMPEDERKLEFVCKTCNQT